MRKNLYALAIAGILAVSTMAPTMVSAATTTPTTPTPQEYQTPVSYKYKDTSMTFDGFTVTVPAALDMTSEAAEIKDKVTVTMEHGRNLDDGKSITVKVKSKNSYKLTVNNTTPGQDDTTSPVYELRAKKENNDTLENATWDGVNAFTANANYQDVASFTNADFNTTADEASKNAWLKANISKKPQVGLDNQKFSDTLTFQVSVV